MDRKNEDAVKFSTVHENELANTSDLHANILERNSEVVSAHLTTIVQPELTAGLALSGGGIRSATFSLGVIQALATNGHLERFEYLSTVSGGGYIGSWLTAWIARERNTGGLEKVAEALKQNAATSSVEPAQVQWLRRYSNYLTPRVGALSMDALTVAVTWLRNTLLNLITLAAVVAFALLIPKTIWLLAVSFPPSSSGAFVSALCLTIVSLTAVAFNLTLHYFPRNSRPMVASSRPRFLWALEPKHVSLLAIAPALLACVTASFGVYGQPDSWLARDVAAYSAVAALGFFVVVGFLWVCAFRIDASNFRKMKVAAIASNAPTESATPAFAPKSLLTGLKESLTVESDDGATHPNAVKIIAYIFAPLFAIAVCAGLLTLAHNLGPQQSIWSFSSKATDLATRVLVFGPPLTMVSLGLSFVVAIGLIGRAYAEVSREWLSRFGGALLLACVVWTIWFALAFYASDSLGNLYRSGKTLFSSVTSIGWVGSLIGSLLLGAFQSGSKSQPISKWRSTLITVLSMVVAAGTFVAIACALDFVLAQVAGEPLNANWLVLCGALSITAAIGLLFAWRVDINRFSLHDMYKMRIIRCYLGASNHKRNPQPFTGFDPDDDMPLKDCGDQRPFHIINTTLNLTQGSELAWQQRKAGSFVMTPAYCGFELSSAQNSTPLRGGRAQLPGFASTEDYASQDENSTGGLTLGMAVATSGAAVSPNMGAQSHPALAVLTTFLNIRLGRWCPNPSMPRFKKASPSFGLRYLLEELLGFTNDKSDFVYLSDGGHFENTGVYELVRRECRHIVMVDAGADPNRTFEDVGNLIHKCRVDFGVEIKLPLLPLFGQPGDFRSEDGSALGDIHYRNGVKGKLLIIKPSLGVKKSEPADIYNYAALDPTFPQQTTLDQWFDEAQFESYRKLGYDLCDEAFSKRPEFWEVPR